MLKSADMIAVLDQVAVPAGTTDAFRRYTYHQVPLCVDTKRITPSPLMVPPAVKAALEACRVPGIIVRALLHNSNLGGFPKRLNKGRTEIQYGFRVDVADVPALHALLDFIARGLKPDDTSDLPPDVAALPETERQSVILARKGQGVFRDALDDKWNSACALTGVGIRPLLRASHIKPWRVSNNEERLCAENGLLLTASLDAAFDAGLLTFFDNGEVVFAHLPDESLPRALGIRPGAKLLNAPSASQQKFLQYHRQNCFSR